MGKGFNSAKNKQAALAKKMQLAKQQQKQKPVLEKKDEPTTSTSSLSDADEAMNDAEDEEKQRLLLQQEFATLLAQNKNRPPAVQQEKKSSFATFQNTKVVATPFTKKKTAGPKVRAKDVKRQKKKRAAAEKLDEPEEIRNDEPLQQGDVAERRDFDQLLVCSNNNNKPLGAMGGAQLVPWVPPYLNEYLVVLADPRPQSTDLRQAISHLTGNHDDDDNAAVILSQVVVIVADAAGETARWVERSDIETPIRILGDPKLEWMRKYSAVIDQERWSMSAYIFDTSGTIRRLVRQVDPSTVSQVVQEMVNQVKDVP